jgi:hypothetical protein
LQHRSQVGVDRKMIRLSVLAVCGVHCQNVCLEVDGRHSQAGEFTSPKSRHASGEVENVLILSVERPVFSFVDSERFLYGLQKL